MFTPNTKIALGIVEDVNRANAETSEYIQQKNTTDPEMQKLVDTLNEFLVPLYDVESTESINFNCSESSFAVVPVLSFICDVWEFISRWFA